MNHDHESTHAMLRDFVVGMSDIIAVHELDAEVALDVVELLGELIQKHVKRPREAHSRPQQGTYPVLARLLARPGCICSGAEGPHADAFDLFG